MIYSGKDGAFLVDGVERSIKVTTVDFENAIQSTNRFQDRGSNSNVEGFSKCMFSGKGPYDAGNYGMIAGKVYTFTHTVGGAISYSVACRVKKLSLSNDAEGKPEISIDAESTGPFVPTIL